MMMVHKLMTDELERIYKVAAVTQSKYNPGICLGD
jgi:hypothetical protein